MAHTLLCFDYGKTKIGVAVGQNVTKTASPLTTVKAKNFKPNWQHIVGLISEWAPDALVVGYPLTENNQRQAMTKRTDQFINQLKTRFALPVYIVSEVLSTYEAKQIADCTDNDDPYAAKIILESWLRETV